MKSFYKITRKYVILHTSEYYLIIYRKAATAIDLDPAGSRLASGSHDYDIKLWDFAAMNTAFRPFRSFEGCETNHVSSFTK